MATADLLRIREALEASWDEKTSYMAMKEMGNPAFGQCYPTCRVVQYFFPEMEIAKGEVWNKNGREIHKHYWNVLRTKNGLCHIDLTWSQFPPGSNIREYVILGCNQLDDSEQTRKRFELLLERVNRYLQNMNDGGNISTCVIPA